MEWVYPKDVEGWFPEREGIAYSRLGKNQVVLEIGSFEGRSTICVAQDAEVVHSVDHHIGDDDVGKGKNTLPQFMWNLEKYKVRKKVNIHVMDSGYIPRIFRPDLFGCVLIDGCHDTFHVRRDFASAKMLVKKDGFVAFHDWSQVGGFFSKSDLEGFVHEGQSDQLRWFRRI